MTDTNSSVHPNRDCFIIVGAGAAGCAAAKSFSIAGLAPNTALFEQHSEPGGCAGYFSRGFPKRTFDAGATQLIECQPGHLQHALFECQPANGQAPAADIFERIPSVTQHWHRTNKKVILHSDGRVIWSGKEPLTESGLADLRRLEIFLSYCSSEAAWMWKLLEKIPRFPMQSLNDLQRALFIFLAIPWQKKLLIPFLLLMNCSQVMRLFRIRRGGLAFDIINGLLIDTTQSSPEKSPWLAAAMGLSIVRRGIYRCRKGMRSYFKPMLRSFEENGGHYYPHQKLRQIETMPQGFRLTFEDQRTSKVLQVMTTRSVMLNFTLWNVVQDLFPSSDPIRKSPVFRRWQRTAISEKGWGAFAIYALIEDNPEWPEGPHYHQIFPSPEEPEQLQSSLYVSIPARNDPAQPPGYRILTATLHVPAEELDDAQRAQYRECLVERIEMNLEGKLSHIETATPRTFERYTGRQLGQVGGFPLQLKNFLFFANPSAIKHPSHPECQLILMGDTVFPGQGVIACSVSGISAFERATRLAFHKFVALHLHRTSVR